MPDLSSKKLLDELKKYNTTVKQNNKEKRKLLWMKILSVTLRVVVVLVFFSFYLF